MKALVLLLVLAFLGFLGYEYKDQVFSPPDIESQIRDQEIKVKDLEVKLEACIHCTQQRSAELKQELNQEKRKLEELKRLRASSVQRPPSGLGPFVSQAFVGRDLFPGPVPESGL